MVTTIQVIEKLRRNNLFSLCVKKGIVSISFVDYFDIYKTYLTYRKKYKKMESYTLTAEDHLVSVATVRIVVSKMES